MRIVRVPLDEPPAVVNAGTGLHGLSTLEDRFRLPDLWQLHLYSYEGALEVGGTVHEIRPGHVSLIPAGTEVRYRYRGPSEHLYIHARLTDRGESHPVPVMQDAGAAAPVLAAMMRQAITAAPQSPARRNAEIWTVLWRLTALRPDTGGDAGDHPAVAAALAYIEGRLPKPITVPDVAAAVGVSHNHLTRLFRAETGTTVVAHIRRRRLERAAHLLRESTLSIPAVAASVGIPDLQAFNKACRRELGASPRALRSPRRS
ncbi:AraC family transcriptional regulator [Glycomyces albidus]|uniref:Helix-turn-helix domain-containing protein n=1 Tax=Glycomyces albidus TaxID=2656774 RepID=A0A6L5GCJ2_9ACTN|nr:helix-turn-helix transcriptional regulator [Glycomyces albidus]MQM27397.1 helix-turn-helix domain-containing protein [Glycomyces albidus]